MPVRPELAPLHVFAPNRKVMSCMHLCSVIEGTLRRVQQQVDEEFNRVSLCVCVCTCVVGGNPLKPSAHNATMRHYSPHVQEKGDLIVSAQIGGNSNHLFLIY